MKNKFLHSISAVSSVVVSYYYCINNDRKIITCSRRGYTHNLLSSVVFLCSAYFYILFCLPALHAKVYTK
jgi:hypothetical protein